MPQFKSKNVIEDSSGRHHGRNPLPIAPAPIIKANPFITETYKVVDIFLKHFLNNRENTKKIFLIIFLSN